MSVPPSPALVPISVPIQLDPYNETEYMEWDENSGKERNTIKEWEENKTQPATPIGINTETNDAWKVDALTVGVEIGSLPVPLPQMLRHRTDAADSSPRTGLVFSGFKIISPIDRYVNDAAITPIAETFHVSALQSAPPIMRHMTDAAIIPVTEDILTQFENFTEAEYPLSGAVEIVDNSVCPTPAISILKTNQFCLPSEYPVNHGISVNSESVPSDEAVNLPVSIDVANLKLDSNTSPATDFDLLQVAEDGFGDFTFAVASKSSIENEMNAAISATTAAVASSLQTTQALPAVVLDDEDDFDDFTFAPVSAPIPNNDLSKVNVALESAVDDDFGEDFEFVSAANVSSIPVSSFAKGTGDIAESFDDDDSFDFSAAPTAVKTITNVDNLSAADLEQYVTELYCDQLKNSVFSKFNFFSKSNASSPFFAADIFSLLKNNQFVNDSCTCGLTLVAGTRFCACCGATGPRQPFIWKGSIVEGLIQDCFGLHPVIKADQKLTKEKPIDTRLTRCISEDLYDTASVVLRGNPTPKNSRGNLNLDSEARGSPVTDNSAELNSVIANDAVSTHLPSQSKVLYEMDDFFAPIVKVQSKNVENIAKNSSSDDWGFQSVHASTLQSQNHEPLSFEDFVIPVSAPIVISEAKTVSIGFDFDFFAPDSSKMNVTKSSEYVANSVPISKVSIPEGIQSLIDSFPDLTFLTSNKFKVA